MASILDRLNAGEVLICDGAMGTTLQSLGCGPGESPEKWGLLHEASLRQIHRSYIEAGADMILTNTFGGNRVKLEKLGLAAEVESLNRELARIAVAEANREERSIYVAGDVGPTGEFMEPIGLLKASDMIEIFSQQIRALVAGGVDVILIETMSDLNEATAAVKAAQSSCDLPVFVSMTYNVDKNGFRTMMGVSPGQAVEKLLEAGVDGIGANCGDVLAAITPALVQQMKAAGARWTLVEPNAGLPQIVDGKTVFPQTPAQMAEHIPAILEAGANIIGGCCGTTPEHIRMIAQAVRRSSAS
jgi:5-methyltetrahydrofolate--homocysteine methyltransferase